MERGEEAEIGDIGLHDNSLDNQDYNDNFLHLSFTDCVHHDHTGPD